MNNFPRLSGVVALVTGATRGVGNGCALGLLEFGAKVHVTGRTAIPGEDARYASHRVDHANDFETEAVVRSIIEEEGRLDILVNSAWPGYERMVVDGRFSWLDPIWDQPMWRWDAMINVGLRSAYCASRAAARQMSRQSSGMIVNLSYWAAQKFMQNTAYGVSKAATDKLSADLAHELRTSNVTVISLYPGLVRTERVLDNAAYLDLSNSESPQFQGRAIAYQFADPMRLEKSGRAVSSAALAEQHGFTDVDGRRPTPLTLDTA